MVEDNLLKLSVDEGVLDVELVDEPVVTDGEGEQHIDGGWVDDKAEGLIVVNVKLLGEAT